MKNALKPTVLTTLCLVFLSSLSAAADEPPGNSLEMKASSRTLVGAWKMTNELGYPFLMTIEGSFTKGTVVLTTFDNKTSPGHGVWKRTERSTFKMKSFSLLYDDDGMAVAEEEVNTVLEIDENAGTFTGTASLTFRTLDGTVLNSFSVGVSGSRIEFPR